MRAFLVAVLAAAPVALAAQEASPYVPLNHWAMPYVEHLISAGVIVDPTPLTRPLRQTAVLQALAAADTTGVSAGVLATMHRLIEEWRLEERRPHYRVELSLGAAAANFAFRDPLDLDRGLPPRELDSHGFGNGGADVQLRFGPLVAVTHPVVDTRLTYDPDWYATTDNATRFAEAYVSGQWRWAEGFFGILDRNWGPSGIQGVLLSANPYSMDHWALALGTQGIQLQSVATQLDTRTNSTGAPVNRYIVLNRLWMRPRGRWALALWDAGVISGVGRQLEPWLLNPASITYFRASSATINTFVGVDVERRGATTLFGQVMLDDIQVSRNDATDLEPASFALTVGAKGKVRSAAVTWTAYYTQAANVAYRTPESAESPLYFGLGTGRNFADYDQATLKLSVLARPSLLLESEVTALRQGEGDPRLPYPVVSEYPTTPVLFQGVVERIVRLALGGSWQVGGLSITGNGGVHFVQNVAHATGASKTAWIGSIGLTYRFHRQNLLP